MDHTSVDSLLVLRDNDEHLADYNTLEHLVVYCAAGCRILFKLKTKNSSIMGTMNVKKNKWKTVGNLIVLLTIA
jgi:hypothetical protein